MSELSNATNTSDTFSYFSRRCAEIQKSCACHSINERDCIRSRYPRNFGPEEEVEDDERCECVCHQEIGELEMELWPEDHF